MIDGFIINLNPYPKAIVTLNLLLTQRNPLIDTYIKKTNNNQICSNKY